MSWVVPTCGLDVCCEDVVDGAVRAAAAEDEVDDRAREGVELFSGVVEGAA